VLCSIQISLFSNADSGDEDEFEGWEPGYILQHVQFFREIDFEQSLNDVNNRDDDEFGWEHKDTFPVCAPFTGKPGLNIEIIKAKNTFNSSTVTGRHF
jgi:hypothetical protein